MPVFFNYVSSSLKNIATNTINKTVKEEINMNIDYNNLISITKNNLGEIQMIDFDSKSVNIILNDVTSSLLNKIDNMELDSKFNKSNYGYEIPIGIVSNNVFLSNLGPKIPIYYRIIGNAVSNIKTDINEYGINNALLTVSIISKVVLEVNVPFIKEEISVEVKNPIIMKVIQGSIPKYYGGNFSKESMLFTIPNN